jgi:hypothetical protein
MTYGLIMRRLWEKEKVEGNRREEGVPGIQPVAAAVHERKARSSG